MDDRTYHHRDELVLQRQLEHVPEAARAGVTRQLEQLPAHVQPVIIVVQAAAAPDAALVEVLRDLAGELRAIRSGNGGLPTTANVEAADNLEQRRATTRAADDEARQEFEHDELLKHIASGAAYRAYRAEQAELAAAAAPPPPQEQAGRDEQQLAAAHDAPRARRGSKRAKRRRQT